MVWAVVEAYGFFRSQPTLRLSSFIFAQAGLNFERYTVMHQQLEKSLDNKARRYAKRVGLHAKKRRGSLGTSLNQGGFMLLEPNENRIVGGERFDLTADDVIVVCKGQR
jgi:hypothetical protein